MTASVRKWDQSTRSVKNRSFLPFVCFDVLGLFWGLKKKIWRLQKMPCCCIKYNNHVYIYIYIHRMDQLWGAYLKVQRLTHCIRQFHTSAFVWNLENPAQRIISGETGTFSYTFLQVQKKISVIPLQDLDFKVTVIYNYVYTSTSFFIFFLAVGRFVNYWTFIWRAHIIALS